ncbi:GHKL domain-containing protein [Lysinibacillus sp. FSL H8-0500]|uniref:sensor histidine kinase n=1 Tax=Lysinibacillus sp. FSL H8-0500 TaxID=2921393 RepID=UPI003100B7DD
MVFSIISFINFLMLFGSLFYICNIRPTIQRLMICLILNAFLAWIALNFPALPWLALLGSVLLSGGFFYRITKKSTVFLHSASLLIIVILIEYMSLFVVERLQLVASLHILLIIVLFTLALWLYKIFVEKTFHQVILPIKVELLLVILSTVTIIVFYLIVFLPMHSDIVAASWSKLMMLACYFLFLFLTIWLLLQAVQKEQLAQQQALAQQDLYTYMGQLENVNREIQKVQHDYANILLSIRGFLDKDNLHGLKKYFKKIAPQEQQPYIASLKQLEQLQLFELKGIVSAKLLQAHTQSIAVHIEIPEPIQSSFIESIDLVKLVGILMDNAIEATVHHQQPQLQLALLCIQTNEQLIIIRNTTKERYADIEKLFQENYSTKGDKRGFGLYNIKQLLHRYPNITLNTYIEEEWFVQEVRIERIRKHASSDL